MKKLLGQTIRTLSNFAPFSRESKTTPSRAPLTAAAKGAGSGVGTSNAMLSAGALKARFRDIGCLPAERRRQKFWDLYLFALDICLRAGSARWWNRAFRYETFPDPDVGVAALKAFCVDHLLSELGDIFAVQRVYDILAEDGYLADDEQGRCLLRLANYVVQGFSEIERLTTDGTSKQSAILSVVAQDDASCTNFLEFCLPSVAPERGFAAFWGARQVILLVSAPARRIPEIERQLHARALDCAIICRAIPAFLVEKATGSARDWVLGGLQALDLMRAKRTGADFFSLNPNAVYGEKFIEKIGHLAKNGKKAVVLAHFRADRSSLKAELTDFTSAGALAIPSGSLVTLALRLMDPTSRATIVEHADSLGAAPSHPQLIWESEQCVHIHSPHNALAFLSKDLLSEVPARFFMPLSREIDRILPADQQPYFVREADDIAMVELHDSKKTADDPRLGQADFARMLWSLARDGQVRHFRHATRMPLERSALGARPWKKPSDIEIDRASIFNAIDGIRPPSAPTATQVLGALSILSQYEMSEYGRENMEGAIATARQLLDCSGIEEAPIEVSERKELIRSLVNFDLVDRAIALARGGGPDTAFIHDFLVEMMSMKAANSARAAALLRNTRHRPISMIGSVVWGESFVRKFMTYCVRSLLATGNMPALAEKGRVVHSIVTTEADRDRIMAHPIYARLSEFAEVVFTCFPAEFLVRREEAKYNFYHFYGLLDHQNVFLAAALQADMYLLPVDCVYSNGSLKNLSAWLDNDADCASIAGIEADETALMKWIASQSREADALELPSEEMLEVASENADEYFRSLIMSSANTAFSRHPRELVWPRAGGFVIHSIFMHPIAVSRRMLSRSFHPHHENVDFALIARLLQEDGRLKVIEDARDVAIAHFGAPQARNDYLEGGFSLRQFLDAHRYDYAVHRRCFNTAQFFPCKGLHQPPSAEYPAELDLIKSALARYRFRLEPDGQS